MHLKNLKMKGLFVAALLGIILSGCASNRNTNTDDYLYVRSKPIIDSFFNNVRIGEYKRGLIDLLKNNSSISLEDSLVLILKERFDQINENFGKFVSDTLVRKNQIGNDVAVYSYLTKYENNFYRFLFTFYYNGTTVKIYKFSFDDNISVELEQAIRFYVK